MTSSSYNKKIVRTSSYIEIWEYEKPIFSKGKSILDNNTENKEKTQRNSCGKHRKRLRGN